MSSIYALEPNTVGRAILTTSHGPLDVHFWSQECPQTTRNFLQHALNGYYNDMPFHRVIPGVLAQTGDPSKTGHGGDAATHPPPGVHCERHGRLRFRRRGLIAMVGDDEGFMRSQFFFTLGATPWLDGKHSIFGCVQGDSVYNLLTLGEREVDGFQMDGVPILKGIQVIENPFPDIVAKSRVRVEGSTTENRTVGVSAKRAVRSNKLLSFRDSDSESGEEGRKVQLKVRKGRIEKQREVKEIATAVQRKNDKRKNADVIDEANAEFERLKAQLTGRKQKEERKVQENNGENVEKDRKSKKKIDESEMLGRLKKFEEKLVSLRKVGPKEGKDGWFEKGLRLRTQAMAEEEYEVRIGGRREGDGREKRRWR